MRFDRAKHPWTRDLTGRRFQRLKVIGFAGMRNQRSHWACRCDCGNRTIVDGSKLKFGSTTSCGCRQIQTGAENCATHWLRHGHARHGNTTAEYWAWAAMKQRCLNPNYHHFQNYGGRGITVCQRWIDSFDAFLADMGRRPSARHSLDRKNNDGNYDPSNSRWITAKQQATNRRRRRN
jgi:hypothetical protein